MDQHAATLSLDITDRELDNIVGSLHRRHPHSGQNMIQGMLIGMGHFTALQGLGIVAAC